MSGAIFEFASINLLGVSLDGPEHFLDPPRIRADLARRALQVAQTILPDGRREGDTWTAPSPFSDATGSLLVSLEGPTAGEWQQEGGPRRGDLLDLMTTQNLKRWGTDDEASQHEATETAMLDAINYGWSDWSKGEEEEVPALAKTPVAPAETLPLPPAEPTAVPSPSADAASWPEPVDFLAASEHGGEPELKPEHLPEALAGFVFDTAKRIGVDPAMSGLAAVVATTGAMSEDWRVQPKRMDHGWTEGPRLWGALVGDPGVAKSPVLSAATQPIDALETAASERHNVAIRAHKAEIARIKREKTDEALPPEPRRERYMAESITVEALGEVLRTDAEAKHNAPLGKVLVRADELSELIAGFDAYRGGKGGDRGAYLRLYDGRSHNIDRIGRGAFHIPRWSASLLGGIQPEPIQRIARDATDDGLLQRFLFCVPQGVREGVDQAPDEPALARYRALFPTLHSLRPIEPGPVILAEEAHAHREEIDKLAKMLLALPDTSPRLKGSLNKLRGQFARLALVFHLIELADSQVSGTAATVDSMIISEETARRAKSYMRDVLVPHLLRADALLYQSRQDSQAHWIGGFILSHAGVRDAGRITRRDLQRSYPAFKTAGADVDRSIAEVMGFLEGMGWVQAEPTKPGERYARAWVVNPKLYEVFAARAAAERQRRDAAREAVTALIQESKRRSDC